MIKMLFMSLLKVLDPYGDLIEAKLYKDGTFANLVFEIEGETYKISLIKEAKIDGNDQN